MEFTSINAYDLNFFNNNIANNNKKFDFMLDDGPHILISMVIRDNKRAYLLYLNLV